MMMAIILLCLLPPSYEHLVTTLTYGKETIKIEEITATLLAQDLRRKNKVVETSQAEGLLVKVEKAEKGQETSRSSKMKNKEKKGPQCYKCKEWGHMKMDCPEYKKAKASANMVAQDSSSESSDDVLSVTR